ncbi:MAG TPA: nuclease-related domain-containing protein [Flavisolibacter sp.]|nr:nuclease-related domain-containing protein [Flavisolibacter sp.]
MGCLTDVKSHLERHNITEFKSLNELIAFQKEFGVLRQGIISRSEAEIVDEKNKLISDNIILSESIGATKAAIRNELTKQIEVLRAQLQLLSSATHIWTRFAGYFRGFALKKRIRNQEQALELEVDQSVFHMVDLYQRNTARYNYISSKFQDAVIGNCLTELRALERKKALIDEVNNSIYGAIGEQKVVRELEHLSDEYVLINDFYLSFDPPIFNRNENDHIRSIQIDHLLVAPSGIFLIETKNWSEQSLNSLSLRSPISQLRRSNFALFVVLNQRTARLRLNEHHWGKKKITLKNLLVMINKKPSEDFQFVKVLTLNQLLSYIKHFPPVFTRDETESIANELIRLSGN